MTSHLRSGRVLSGAVEWMANLKRILVQGGKLSITKMELKMMASRKITGSRNR